MAIYRINKRFTSSVQRTPRVLEVAEAFGIGLEDKEFVVYDNLEIEINQGDVVYITGQSGSGKSLLLKELAKQMAETMEVANIDTVVLDERPLIDQVGNSMKQASEILCASALNDAQLFLKVPSQLSDGQLYRLKIAKLINSTARVWVADEFGAVLDRTTAKEVAHFLQREARKVGATVIVATTHKDLRDELGPNLYIDKRFREKIRLEKAA